MSPARQALLAATLAAHRRITLRLPDTVIIDRPGLLQVVTPSLRHGGLNEVACFAASEADAEAELSAALARFEGRDARAATSAPLLLKAGFEERSRFQSFSSSALIS